MVSFESDYNNGMHPLILKRFAETNDIRTDGYGEDEFCRSAAEKIRKVCGCPDADVFFLTGGTQTNSIVISSMLRPFEGVVAADSGHISVHEAGAIEYSGHKVLQLEGSEGRISSHQLREYLRERAEDENREHMVFPGMVYISYPTEYGTLYSREELQDIYSVCSENGLPLFIDGARLGYGLMSPESDLTLEDIAEFCDVFYIGGTKVGALCGEAVVFTKSNTPRHFVNFVKKNGALTAKGRLLGVQFDTLFTDDLYFRISEHAIDMAEKLRKMLIDKGYEFFIDSPTNQLFVIVNNEKLELIQKNVKVSFWERIDEEHSAVRLATSWSTTDEELTELQKYL